MLPTFNERGNLASLVERLDKALAGISWEAIFVDDNSPDGTSDEARKISQHDRRVRVLHRIGRRGLASAAIEGMMATAAPVVAVMDADHQHDPVLLPGMLKAVASGEYDVAVASRFAEGASTEEWGRPDRVKRLEHRQCHRPQGYRRRSFRSDERLFHAACRNPARQPRLHLSGVGFKILLDILATSEETMRVKEFPLNFAARAEGESKLDRTVVFEFLVGLYDKWLGRIIPTRFALFGTIGAMGVVVHMAVLSTFLTLAGETLRGNVVTEFELGQTIAALVAMTFNFFLNNALTYADKRLTGAGGTAARLDQVWPDLLGRPACQCRRCRSAGALRLPRISGCAGGIVIGSVWNFALSSKFVWGRYGN